MISIIVAKAKLCGSLVGQVWPSTAIEINRDKVSYIARTEPLARRDPLPTNPDSPRHATA